VSGVRLTSQYRTIFCELLKLLFYLRFS